MNGEDFPQAMQQHFSQFQSAADLANSNAGKALKLVFWPAGLILEFFCFSTITHVVYVNFACEK